MCSTGSSSSLSARRSARRSKPVFPRGLRYGFAQPKRCDAIFRHTAADGRCRLNSMEEIGLFPLGLVLLPTEQVPLHIFEPRYRELIGESLEQGVPFGIVYADDDGLRQVGTLATVTEVVERFADGRLNVVVEGGERFRLLELTEGRPF